ncbi:Polysaccharide monooxygenase Cel61a [Paramyrothecium foliicola]|nr:Polysaccharide monooxygenase Cel61a [Paramyrothecium foliicola]
MAKITLSTVAAAAAVFATGVAAHGHVDWVIINGVAYRGYDSPRFLYEPNHQPVIGWSINQPDNGFVEPNKFGTDDIICHNAARPAPVSATVRAGDKITLQWDTWPESHKGPVIDYLARCSGECETVDKTQLEFFKISAGGLIDRSMSNGKWADDVLMANNFQWTVQIPADLAAGNYVLRHEILALHSAGQPNGAQAYPQCINIKVTGGGSLRPAGVKGTSLYRANDPGVVFDLYNSPTSYPIPGPALVAGLPATAAQSIVRATATTTLVVGGAAPTQAPTQASTQVPPQGTTTLRTSTTIRTSTSTTPPQQTGGNGNGGTAAKWGQCGGQGWTGPTRCAAGSTCQVTNQWYSQCL